MRSMDYPVLRLGARHEAGWEWFEIVLVPWVGRSFAPSASTRLFHFQQLGIGHCHPAREPRGVEGLNPPSAATGGTFRCRRRTWYEHVHIQAIVRATTTGGVGQHEGIGILEQLAVGRPDMPTGLEGLIDGYEPK